MAMTSHISHGTVHNGKPFRRGPTAARSAWPECRSPFPVTSSRRSASADISDAGPPGPPSAEPPEPPSAEPPADELPADLGEACDRFIRLLYVDYGGLLLSVVVRLTGGDRHWAEDVVQETLLRAWRHADKLIPACGSRNLMPWLVTVARRIIINDWRSRDARPTEVDDTLLGVVAVPDDSERVLQRLVVMDALGRLTPAHRRVLVEVYFLGRTMPEVARIVGIPPGTVKSRVFNALRMMRATMHSNESRATTSESGRV